MNEREAASIVAVIAAAFPSWNASRETVAVYVDALDDLDFEETRAAVRDLLLTEDRWPTIAGIRRRVASRAGALAPSPSQVWSEIQQNASTIGRGSSPEFSHPAILEAVRAIGWWNICSSSNPETMRAQFLRIYEDTQKRHDLDVLSVPGRIALGAGTGDRPRRGGSLAEPESPPEGDRR